MSCPHFDLTICVVMYYVYLQGLATAYTLRRAGHSVVVLEKGDAKSTVRFCLKTHSKCLDTPELSEIWHGWYLVSKHIIYDFFDLFTRNSRAPPNMTRLLYRWGLGPILDEKGTKCNKVAYINGAATVYILT